MEDTRIDRLESRQDQLAAELRNGFRAVDARLCKLESLPDRIDLRIDQVDIRLDKIEARLEQTATKVELRAIEARLDQTATKAELRAIEARLDQTATKAELRAIEVRLDQTATKAELIEGLSKVREEIHSANAAMKTWMLATMISIIGTFVVLFGIQHWSG